MCKKVVVFDLDDTLYKEIEFLKSGYRKVSELVEKRYGLDAWSIYDQLLFWYNQGENAFACLNDKYGIDNPINDYLNVYRYHQPIIDLTDETKETLSALKATDVLMAIITDGRMITQKQKIEALGLTEWISWDFVLINEEKKYFKPNHWSFDRMMLKCFEEGISADTCFYYVGDNPEKDFLAPNQLGWESICLKDDGRNIHKQVYEQPKDYLPHYKINEISELVRYIY